MWWVGVCVWWVFVCGGCLYVVGGCLCGVTVLLLLGVVRVLLTVGVRTTSSLSSSPSCETRTGSGTSTKTYSYAITVIIRGPPTRCILPRPSSPRFLCTTSPSALTRTLNGRRNLENRHTSLPRPQLDKRTRRTRFEFGRLGGGERNW